MTSLYRNGIYPNQANYSGMAGNLAYAYEFGMHLQYPMVTESFGFYRKTNAGGKPHVVYEPALIQALPPGNYRLRAYHDFAEFQTPACKPYFETRIEVPAHGGKIKINVPYDPMPPNNVPQPVTE